MALKRTLIASLLHSCEKCRIEDRKEVTRVVHRVLVLQHEQNTPESGARWFSVGVLMTATMSAITAVGQILPPVSGVAPEREARNARLSSWKEIAAYLDRGVRTVQRWHADLQLPVHKLTASPKSPVFAYKEEVDRWLRQCAQREAACSERTTDCQDIVSRPVSKQASVVSRSESIRERLRQTAFGFLLTEAGLALTLVRIAARSADAGERDRRQQQALRAYETIHRFAGLWAISEAQRVRVAHQLAIVKAELDKLG